MNNVLIKYHFYDMLVAMGIPLLILLLEFLYKYFSFISYENIQYTTIKDQNENTIPGVEKKIYLDQFRLYKSLPSALISNSIWAITYELGHFLNEELKTYIIISIVFLVTHVILFGISLNRQINHTKVLSTINILLTIITFIYSYYLCSL